MITVDSLDPVEVGALISTLPINHPLVAAAKLAVEVAFARHAARIAHRDISRQVSTGTDWRRVAAKHVPYDELQRRRAAPGPMPRRAA